MVFRRALLALVILMAALVVGVPSPRAQIIPMAFWQSSVTYGGSGAALRFRSAGSTYLGRTFGSGNQAKFTISAWVKRTKLDVETMLLSHDVGWNNADARGLIGFTTGNQFIIYDITGGVNDYGRTYTPIFRDTSAWYHIVVVIDTAQAAGADRQQLYVNGQRITSVATDHGDFPANVAFNNAGVEHRIGYSFNVTPYSDMYLADYYFIDGQALTPGSFGGFNANGIWVPKTPSGLTYGTNGFYLPFSDASAATAAALGNSVPNANDWTPSGFSVANDATRDAVNDSPDMQSESSSNYANGMALEPQPGPVYGTYSDGGLRATIGPDGGNTSNIFLRPSIRNLVGKYYFEVTVHTQTLHPTPATVANYIGLFDDSGYYLYGDKGVISSNSGVISTSVAAWAANDVLGVAFDTIGGSASWYRNGALVHTQSIPTLSTEPRIRLNALNAAYTPGNGVQSLSVNFGQRPWVYGPPNNTYKGINTYNMPAPDVANPSQYFKTATYTGNGVYQSIGEPAKQTSSVNIANSLRFRAANNAHLTRTPVSLGHLKAWTYSLWIKRGALSGANSQYILEAFSNLNNRVAIQLCGADCGGAAYEDTLATTYLSGGAAIGSRVSSAKIRDTAAWHHVVVSWDTANPLAADRIKLYIDGVRLTSFIYGVDIGVSGDTLVGHTVLHTIGRHAGGGSNFDGYLGDVYLVDGLSLPPSSFAETDANGDWVPKAYTGSYGVTGFHLNFSDTSNTTATTLGKDAAGANNWTPNNFSVAAGVTNDALTDVPTAYDATHGNFATLNAAANAAGITLSNGALTAVVPSNNKCITATMPVTTGKWYFEVNPSTSTSAMIGVGTGDTAKCGTTDYQATPGRAYASNGLIYQDQATTSGSPATYTSTDVIGVAIDADSGTISWYKNNVLQATNTLPPNTRMLPMVGESVASGVPMSVNFGQRPFVYTPPAGYNRMQSYNFANASFAPDLVIIKNRSGATDWAWYDRARGPTLEISSNLTNAQSAQGTGLLSFQNGGFTAGSSAKLNTAGNNYVSYMFKKGATPGFDVQSFTVPASGTYDVPHALGAVPEMVIIKSLDSTPPWVTYNAHLSSPSTQYLELNTGAAAQTFAGIWPNMTSSAYRLTVGTTVSANQKYLGYAFRSVPGFSKFGSYTGNGAVDGPFVYTGFKPALVIVKRVDAGSEQWLVYDNQRTPYNGAGGALAFQSTAGEDTAIPGANSNGLGDFISNGFKIRSNGGSNNSASGLYIYAAFAENPFKGSPAK